MSNKTISFPNIKVNEDKARKILRAIDTYQGERKISGIVLFHVTDKIDAEAKYNIMGTRMGVDWKVLNATVIDARIEIPEYGYMYITE